MIKIRAIKEMEAQKYIDLYKKLDEETIFRLYNPDERKITVEDQKKEINNIIKSNNSIILVAEYNDELVGYLSAYGRSQEKIKHTVTIGIAILQEYTKKGIGTMLFRKLEDWAKENNIHRLELTVMENNVLAQELYKKVGFEIEGIKRNSIYVNGEYINDIYMSKLI